MNAFGVFQEYYHQHQLRDKSAFDIAWIGSFSSFMLFASAAPAGLLVDKIGPTVRAQSPASTAVADAISYFSVVEALA